MKYARLSDTTYVLRLERGERIHETIQSFCSENQVANASITGIGSIEDPRLAHYTIATKKFTERPFKGIYEITSLLGNVGLLEGLPMSHLHITISGPDMQVFGGHLVSGTCSGTMEVFVHRYDTAMTKRFEEAVGLNVWDFPDSVSPGASRTTWLE
jgi:predicted DNA-binding protein with PD1-like motif